MKINHTETGLEFLLFLYFWHVTVFLIRGNYLTESSDPDLHFTGVNLGTDNEGKIFSGYLFETIERVVATNGSDNTEKLYLDGLKTCSYFQMSEEMPFPTPLLYLEAGSALYDRQIFDHGNIRNIEQSEYWTAYAFADNEFYKPEIHRRCIFRWRLNDIRYSLTINMDDCSYFKEPACRIWDYQLNSSIN